MTRLKVVIMFGKVIYPLVTFYWWIFHPKSSGVKGIIQYDDCILMVRNSYGNGRWTLPGGGIKKNEKPREAVIREIWEELNIVINKPLYLGHFVNTSEGKIDTVHCFYQKVNSADFSIDRQEIIEAAWQKYDEVRTNKRPTVIKALGLLKGKNFLKSVRE